MKILADDFVKIYESKDPENVRCYSPGITGLNSGRLVTTFEISGGPVHGLVYTSDDKGKTWQHKADFPIAHARPFEAGGSLYIIGKADDLTIIRSDDDGETWTKPSKLTDGESWHQAPSNVHYSNGKVYLVMEKVVYTDIVGWAVSVLAPVLMRGDVENDLTKRENWTFASELSFRDVIDERDLDYHGIPFYDTPPKAFTELGEGRFCGPIGWLETNVVQFNDPNHYWHDENGETFHLWMRAHTGRTNYACIAKVVENSDGSMVTMLERAPSGKKIVYVPCPGGQMKFHILFDEVTGLYWLISTQSTDSMTRAENLPEERYNLPDNERNRLQLHFSTNCIDWCFAGMIAIGKSPKQSRHYASMVIDGDDLRIVSRSGDENAKDPHNVNLITYHTVKNFRSLVY